MGSMARILVDDIEFIMVCSVCLTCRFSVLSEYIFVFWDSSNQDRFHWTGEHFSAADMRKTSSASSTDSSYLDHYSFGNLPTFASTKRNSQKNAQPNASFQNEASFYNLSTNSATPNKVELPFVPSKNYPINKSFLQTRENHPLLRQIIIDKHIQIQPLTNYPEIFFLEGECGPETLIEHEFTRMTVI